MLGIKTAVIRAEWVSLSHSGIEQRSRRDPAAMPLLPPFADADRFLTFRVVSGSQLGAATSHTACARKQSSSSPARNWGRPKRSRVKYGRIRSSRVFYHVGGALGKVPQ